jgi:hypothetical protein
LKRRISAWAVALVLAATPGGMAALSPATAAAKSCPSGLTSARIHHQHKCLHAGEYCAKRWNHAYHRYGYDCHGSRPRLHHR